jgi:hypothetical protein
LSFYIHVVRCENINVFQATIFSDKCGEGVASMELTDPENNSISILIPFATFFLGKVLQSKKIHPNFHTQNDFCFLKKSSEEKK